MSPLSSVQSELLARTTPTIWDVMIAFFGGLAGIIASTRREKTSVIPGVAIATALMPPLCTAGFGIANGSPDMFFGASYLFFINCVFIAFATLLMVGYLNPPHKQFVSKERETNVKRAIYFVVLATTLPSIYLAYGLVTSEMFTSRANEFIRDEMSFDNSFIARQKIDPDKKTIDITLVGKRVDEDKLAEISKRLVRYRLAGAKLVVHQTVVKELDEATLKKSLLTEVLSSNQRTFDVNNKEIVELKNEISAMKEERGRQAAEEEDRKKMVAELAAQYPAVEKIALSRALEVEAGGKESARVLLVDLTLKKALSAADRRRIVDWLRIRAGVDEVKLAAEPVRRQSPNKR